MITRFGALYSRKLLLAIGTLMLSALLLSGGSAYAAEANGGEVTDGESFVAALSGQATFGMEEDVCVITLNDDVELTGAVLLKSGSYALQGAGTITRAAGFTEPLLKVYPGASLEITDHVAIDGGARWVKNGESTGSAVGAEDAASLPATKWALIDNLGGTLMLSGDAEVRNNDGRCAIWSQDGGRVAIEGGQVHGVRSDDGGGAVTVQNSTVVISDGKLWGNEVISGFRSPKGSAVYSLSGGSITVSGGELRENSGPAVVEGVDVAVTGGIFSDNAGAALGSDSSSDTVRVSKGTFSNNAGGLYIPIGDSSASLHLFGNPVFINESDATVCSTVNLDDALDDSVKVQIQLDSYKLGKQVLFGAADLLAAHHAQFSLVGSEEGYIVNQYGRIDTESSGIVTPGDVLAATLGGTCSYDEESGVYTVTVNDQIALSETCSLDEPGTYVLRGSGTISRAEGFTEPVLKFSSGVSLEITDHVAIDGGAKWVKDGETTGSAVGAEDAAGLPATKWALIDNLGGEFTLSGDAQVRNNNGRCGIWGKDGARINIAGGQVHGIRSDDGGGAIACQSTTVTISGGKLWGNEVISGFRSPKGSAVYSLSGGSITVSGGELRENSGPAMVEGVDVAVTGGTFSDNLGAALGSDSSSDRVRVSGGTFTGNTGGLYASIDGSTALLHLSGESTFGNEGDSLVHSGVYLDEAIPTGMILPLELDQFKLGDQVLAGDSELVSAHYSQFPIVGAYESYVVNKFGCIAVDPSVNLTDGEVLAAYIGGTCAQDEETGVYTITLNGGTAQLDEAYRLKPGKYVLQGSGTITRAAGFTKQLLILSSDVSLEICGDVVIDGGAVWEGASTEGSAVGVTGNSGTKTDVALIDNFGGTLTLSGNADIRNNDGACAVYSADGGLINIEGGQIHGVRSRDGGGAVKVIGGSLVTVSDGVLWGNEVPSSGSGLGKGSAIYAEGSAVTIEGGTFKESSGPAMVAATNLTVTGGAFKDNSGAALGTYNTSSVLVSGGVFSGNTGGAFACTNNIVSLQLSGSPVFDTELDAVRSAVQVVGELTGSDVSLMPASFEVGTVAVQGTDDYTMTERDAAKFKLTGDVPEGVSLCFEPENNRMILHIAGTGEGYTVSWMNGDGVLEVDENVPEGTVPSYDGEVPTRAADAQYTYAFAGWATEDGVESGVDVDKLPSVTCDVTYYAAFGKTVNTYAVTFTDGQGNTISTQEVAYGSAAEAPADPVREGFLFEGWDADFSNVTGDLQVNALWRDVSAANEVIALIDALPEAGEVSVGDEADIADAQAAYEALSDSDKAYVDAACGVKLTDVAAALQAAKDAAADAAAVIALISALPAPEDVAVDSELAIEAAREAYDNLSAAAKTLVDESLVSKLSSAELALERAKEVERAAQDAAAAREAAALIEALPDPGAVTVGDEAAIAAAQAAYDALSPGAKALVDEACVAKLAEAAAALQAAKDASGPDGQGDGPSAGPAPEKAKATNPMVVKAKKAVKVKATKVAGKAVKVARKKAIAVSGAKGAVTYKLKSVKKSKFKKYFKVAKKSGKIKVKKGLKRGTYRLKIAVTAAGDASYNPVTKVVTVKVKVK